ncbi:GlxA family transcriptional regulator [Salinarimonas sp.]|uniref:GlxA family transcriptional regulator n=1 Tax=Salinarimonas sp. TaxID=2766526 RepID=UPI0032D8ECC2
MDRGADIVEQTIVFLLVPGLSMMSLASAVEPLRALNRLVGADAYRWRLASLDGAPVAASNGIPLPAEPLESALDEASALFVCGGLRIQLPDERAYLAALRKAARRPIAIGSLSTGAYLLARAGLLDGYRCTIHWENRPAFREEFPDLACSAAVFEIDRERLTCSGGTAAMDMMLQLIADRFGADHARFVANQFHHDRIRASADEQRGGAQEALALLPPKLRQAIALMQRQIEAPVPLPAIAKRVGLSPRQLERLFLRNCGMTPLRYYMQLRIERARELLLYSDRPVIEVAIAAGFTSTSHFASWYKRLCGMRPSDARKAPSRARASRPERQISDASEFDPTTS